jgi:hypothetical protein
MGRRRVRFRLLPVDRDCAGQHRQLPQVRTPLVQDHRRTTPRTQCRRREVVCHRPAWRPAIHRARRMRARQAKLAAHRPARRIPRRQRVRPQNGLSPVRMVPPRAPSGQRRRRRRNKGRDRGITRGGAPGLVEGPRRAMSHRRTVVGLAAEVRLGSQIAERRARLTVLPSPRRQRRSGTSRGRPARVVTPCDQARRPVSGPPVADRRTTLRRTWDAVPLRRQRARLQIKRAGRRAPRRPQRGRKPARERRRRRIGRHPSRTPEDRRQEQRGMRRRSAAVPVRRRRRAARRRLRAYRWRKVSNTRRLLRMVRPRG